MASMFDAPGTMFAGRGGNTALERRAEQLAQYQQVARGLSMLPPDQEAPEASGLKSAFFRVVDMISRPNYAVAGFVDTMLGNGKEGEYAAERAFRELFSGIAGLKGDKEMFGQVLEQAGVGEGAKLSDLIGENGLTKNFNPSTRGAVGLALDIFLDPLTWVSAPAKNAAVIVGAGGEIGFLNKAGRAARITMVEEKLKHWRGILNVADDVPDHQLMDLIGKSKQFAEANTDVAAALASGGGRLGRSEVMFALEKEVGEQLYEAATTGGLRIFEPTGLRFRVPGMVDVPLGFDKFVAKVSNTLWQGMKKSDRLSSIVNFTEDTARAFDKVFEHIGLPARKNTEYYRMRQFQHMRLNAADHIARSEAETILRGIHRRHWDDRDLWRQFAVALEDIDNQGEALANWVMVAKEKGIDVAAARGFVQRWRSTFDRVGQVEVDALFLDPTSFLATKGRYWHRVVDGIKNVDAKNELRPISHRSSGKISIEGTDASARTQRRLEGWMDFEKRAKELGATDDEIILDPFKVAQARLNTHYQDMINATFLDDVARTFDFRRVDDYKEFNQILTKLAATELTPEEEVIVAGLRARSSTLNPDTYTQARHQEIQNLIMNTDQGQALARIDEMVEKVRKDIGDVKAELWKREMANEYRRMQTAFKRADIFDLSQTRKASMAETRMAQEIMGELKADEKQLRSFARQFRKEFEDAQKLGDEVIEGEKVVRKIGDQYVEFDVRSASPFAREEAVARGRIKTLMDRKKAVDEEIGLTQARIDKAGTRAEVTRQKKVLSGLKKDVDKINRELRKQAKTVEEAGPRRALEIAQDTEYRIRESLIRKRGRLRNLRRAGNNSAQLERSIADLEGQLALARQAVTDARAGVAEAGEVAVSKLAPEMQSMADALRTRLHLLDEAAEEADKQAQLVEDLLKERGEFRDAYDDMILAQRQQIREARDATRAFWKEMEEGGFRLDDGETVRSLVAQQELLRKEMDELLEGRKAISARQAELRDEIRIIRDVFNPLDEEIARLTAKKQRKIGTRKQLQKYRTEVKAELDEMGLPRRTSQIAERDHQILMAMRPEVRAAFLAEQVSKIESITHFEHFFRKNADVLESVDGELRKLAGTVANDLRDQYGQKYTKVKVNFGKRVSDEADDWRVTIENYSQERELMTERIQHMKMLRDRNNTAIAVARNAGDEEYLALLVEKKQSLDARIKLETMDRRDLKQKWKEAIHARNTLPKNGGTRELYLPQGIADDLTNLQGIFLENPEVSKLLHVYDKLNNWFKLTVTRWFPSFHVRNMYSNVAASFTDIGLEALNPQRAFEAMQVLRGADGTIRIGNRNIPMRMLRDEVEAVGVYADRQAVTEMTQHATRTTVDPVEAVIDQILKREGALESVGVGAKKFYGMTGEVENHARIMHYLALRRRGYTMQDAAMQVNKFLFDYNALSPTERAVFRRLFPFWTWTAKNIKRQVANLYERPGRVAMQTKAFAGDRGPSGDLMPEYLRGQMNIQLTEDGEGETWLTGVDLPVANLKVLWAGSIEKTFKEQMGMLSPFIKNPLEIGSGRSFFDGSSLRGVDSVSPRQGAFINRNWPPVLKDWLQLENVGTEAEPKWQANRLKLHILLQSAFLSRIVSDQTRFQEALLAFGNGDKEEGAKLALTWLSSLHLRSYNFTEKQRNMIYNRARRLEEMLVNAGKARQFDRTFVPDEVKQEAGVAEVQSTSLFGGGGR